MHKICLHSMNMGVFGHIQDGSNGLKTRMLLHVHRHTLIDMVHNFQYSYFMINCIFIPSADIGSHILSKIYGH